eukprot:TRINITY_DN2044_c0_g1_i2.p1 TRINITY_DN2044_c0_g1~~TRINITY_DN2044_c0_g1_i2.p1  ORF type:complete len:610 (-),score=146.02 TRINITY_DN2044_c0_g1_i2:192-2021(-)
MNGDDDSFLVEKFEDDSLFAGINTPTAPLTSLGDISLFEDESKDTTFFSAVNNNNNNNNNVFINPGVPVRTGNAIQYHCDYCHKDISNVVRIKCSICTDFDLCVECFSVGAQINPHLKTHDYQVMDNMHFPLFTEDWGADEEQLLLEAIDINGLGNWVDIAEHVGTKTPADCRDHYFGIYLNVPTSPLPDTTYVLTTHEMILNAKKRKPVMVNPINLPSSEIHHNNTKTSGKSVSSKKPHEKPVTPTSAPLPNGNAVNDMKSHPLTDSVGYMKNRGEFETEWENDAEKLLANMIFDEEDSAEDRAIKVRVIDSYNEKLDERARRQKFILEHGLLDYRKLLHSEKKRTKDERSVLNAMKVFLQAMEKEEHEEISQGLLAEKMIRRRIEKLQNYRQNGLRTNADIETYESERKKRDADLSVRRTPYHYSYNNANAMRSGGRATSRYVNRDDPYVFNGSSTPTSTFNSTSSTPSSVASTPSNDKMKLKRKPGTPLEVDNLPGVESLSPKEKTLCSNLRLFPKQYLLIKETIINEHQKTGNLTRQQARLLFKIDVNKTGKVFDFIEDAGWLKPNIASATENDSNSNTNTPPNKENGNNNNSNTTTTPPIDTKA